MADKQVSIKLDANLGGNAAQGLDQLASKAKTAAAEAKALQGALSQLGGANGARAAALTPRISQAAQATGAVGGPGNPALPASYAMEFYRMRSSLELLGKTSQSTTTYADNLRLSLEKLGQTMGQLAGSAAAGGPGTPGSRTFNQGSYGSGVGGDAGAHAKKVGMGRRGLFSALSGGNIGGYNLLAGATLGIFAASQVGHAAGEFAHLTDTAANRDMPMHLKAKNIVEQLPGIGSLVEGIGALQASFTGLSEVVREANVAFDRFKTISQRYEETRAAALPYIQQMEGIHATAGSYEEFPVGFLGGRRPTPGNQYEIGRSMAQAPHIQQMEQAERNKYSAAEADRHADRRLKQAQELFDSARYKIAEGQRLEQLPTQQGPGPQLTDGSVFGLANYGTAKLMDYAWGSKSKTDVHALGLQMQEEGLRQQSQAEDHMRQAREEKLAAARQMIGADSQSRKAGIGLLQEEYGDITRKEATLTGQVQSWGGMLPGSRGAAMQAFKQAQRIGYESLGEHQRGLIRSLRPEYARKEEEKIGQKYSREFEEIRKLAPETTDDGRSLKELRAEQVNVSQQLNVAVALDAQEVAKQTAEILGPLIKEITIAIAQANTTKVELDELKRKQAMGGAAGR